MTAHMGMGRWDPLGGAAGGAPDSRNLVVPMRVRRRV